ncbi:MAG: polyprenol monophosphomannose synthase [Actinomycetes bacterium]
MSQIPADDQLRRQTVVVVPTYNERDSLPGAVSRLRAAVPEATILVVDDNSPDGTGELADSLAAADEHVRVLHRPGKEGLGAAYLAGFAAALQQGAEAVVEMDADGSHRAEDLPRLLAALDDGADVVLGSRWVSGGATVNWPLTRQLISRAGTTYARVVLGTRIRDITGGFRAYRAEALRKLDLDTVTSQGYCFQIDLAWRAVQAGLEVVEVPITFVERELGESKMSTDIVREAILQVTRWGLRHRSQQAARLLGRERPGGPGARTS